MKGRSVLLDTLAGRRVAVLLSDGRLDDLLFDPPEGAPPGPGAIARALPERPMKGMGGLFVRLPGGVRGYLKGEKPLPPGEPVLVQVTGRPEPGKALPVTRKLLFKSRFAIVTPGAPGLNVSRSIRDEQARARLRTLAEDAMDGSAMGLILRSETEHEAEDEVVADIADMRALAEAVTGDAAGDPQWLTEAPDAHHLAWRDWARPDEIDTGAGCLADRGLLEEIAALALPDVPLQGGSFMSVEPTRALVAVDVNTGAESSPAAALKANLAALRALPRALRLRGLGGQVVVDLAPLMKKDRKQAEQVARAALKACPVETALVGWTPLGHLELQRKRERAPLDAALLEAAR
ncbi:ribonuclease G [Rhodovulum sp. 12E13]|uniref:ribonuclease E/G n=1 Tax=Rhodovulum sp. 12E13 TaxID=2203891 RepID=UPI000E119CAB|nr:ribonuclease E/G [Rhodovulum sp. 12E13]RDC71357.1 ribonuclease G [Rhodovulum sp. 12E13]